MLLNPNERDRSTCELLRRQDYAYGSDPTYSHCHVNAVIVAPQRHEPPIFVVFLAEKWSANFAKEGVPKGHFVLFASDGAVLPVDSRAAACRRGTSFLLSELPTPS